MGRAPCCEKVGLKRGRWTAEEDDILTKYILVNGEGSWRSLPKNAGLLRCGKSCRLRWINYLRADLRRGNISKDEEETIFSLHSAFGNRWSFIAAHLPGRTDNEIKNYWNSHLSRKIYCFAGCRKELSPTSINIASVGGGCKRRGGRTSRSAMKRHKAQLLSMGNPKYTNGTTTKVHEPTLKVNTTPLNENSTQAIELVAGELEESFNAAGSPSPSKEREVYHEVFGPYEWLDSEIKRLKYIWHREAMDPTEGDKESVPLDIPQNGDGVLNITSEERGATGVMGPDKVVTHINDQERHSSSNIQSYNNEESGELCNCYSPVNSMLEEEEHWLDWEYWTSGEYMHLGNGEDNILSCLNG